MDGRIAALAFCMVFLACCAGPGAGLLTGYASHSTYSGFAEPHPSFLLSPAGITFQEDSGSEAVHVQADDFAVYRYGYASLDGKEWERFELSGNALGGDWLNGTVSGDIAMEPSDFGLTQERLSTQRNFVVVYSCSRTGGTWDCHDGWQIWQFDVSFNEGVHADVIGVSASDFMQPYSPRNTLDGDMSWESRWSAEGDGQWIEYELSDEVPVGWVNISSYSGGERTLYFSIDVSADGSQWTEVYDGSVHISAPVFYTATFPETPARYVRLVGHGSSFSGPDGWNSYTEIRIEDFTVNLPPADPCDAVNCDDTNPCTADSCSGGTCSNVPITSCASGDSCCPSGCSHETDADCTQPPEPGANAIDVIGPHEFWTHENAQDGDYVGYVKFFDMDESVDPAFSIVSGNNGAFSITKDKETSGDMFPGGLIKVADAGLLSPGATYTLGVRVYDSATGKDSTTDVVVHVASSSQTVYFDPAAASGGDGSYSHPYRSPSAIGEWNFESGKVYLLRRGGVFGYPIDIQDASINEQNPIVFGAYGQGDRPVLDGTSGSGTVGIYIGVWNSVETMSYIYIQNLEIRDWPTNGITNSGSAGNHHIWFTDIYLHDSGAGGGGSWWLWAPNQQDPGDMHIYIVDSEVANSKVYSGTKWYAGGIRAYNFKTHGNDGNGLRFVSENDASGKFCYGCVSYGNGHTGFQMRTSDSHLRYFKSYDNGWDGIEILADNSSYPERFMRSGFLVEEGIISGNQYSGIEIWGLVSDVVVRNVTITATDGSGVRILGQYGVTNDITVEDSTIYGNSGQGVFISDKDSAKGYSKNVYVKDNTVSDNLQGGILADFVNGLTVTGNTFSGNGGEAISYDPSTTSGVVISGNTGA